MEDAKRIRYARDFVLFSSSISLLFIFFKQQFSGTVLLCITSFFGILWSNKNRLYVSQFLSLSLEKFYYTFVHHINFCLSHIFKIETILYKFNASLRQIASLNRNNLSFALFVSR